MAVEHPCPLQLSSPTHDINSPPQPTKSFNTQAVTPSSIEMQQQQEQNPFDYSQRAQWLRAAVLGASDGLISVASLMIGVGAINRTAKAMLVSGLAGLIAGACSMAIGEYVSVHSQLDVEVSQIAREEREASAEEVAELPKPLQAAGASAGSFAAGAVLPLVAGGFIQHPLTRVGVVAGVSSLGLVGFGAAGSVLGGTAVVKPAVRVLVGGWAAMFVTYCVVWLFGLAFGTGGFSQ